MFLYKITPAERPRKLPGEHTLHWPGQTRMRTEADGFLGAELSLLRLGCHTHPREVLYYYSDLENRYTCLLPTEPVAGKVLLFPHPSLPCQVLGGSCYKLVLENHVVTKYNQEESQGLIIPKPPRYNTQVTRAPKTHTRRHKTILSSFSIIPRVLNRNCSGGWAQSCKKQWGCERVFLPQTLTRHHFY